MWFGSYNGLHKHEGTYIKVYNRSGKDSLALSSKEMHAVFEDKKGFIWVGTTGGLDKLNPTTNEIRHYPLKSSKRDDDYIGYIISIFQDDKEDIWVCTDAGIFILNDQTGAYSEVLDKEKSGKGMPSDFMLYKSTVKTKTGLWIYTTGYLVYYEFKTRQFFHQYHNPLHKPIFNLLKADEESPRSEMCMDKDSNLFFVFNHSTLIRYNLVTEKIDSFRFTFPANAWKCCYSLAADHKGNIWIGFRYGGIQYFNQSNKTFTPIRYSDENSLIKSDYIYSMCEDYLQRMWVSTNNGMFIIQYDDSIVKQKYLSDKKEFINVNYEPAIISEDKAGNLYIPFRAGGLFKYDIYSKQVSYFPVLGTDVPSYGYAFTQQQNKTYIAANQTLLLANATGEKLKVSKDTSKLVALIGKKPGNVAWGYQYNRQAVYIKKTDGNVYYFNGTNNLETIVGQGFSKQMCVSQDSQYLYILNYDYILYKRNLATLKTDTFSFKKQLHEKKFAYNTPIDIAEDGAGNIWMCSQNGLIKYNVQNKTVAIYTTVDGLLHDFCFTLCVDSKKRLWVGSMGGVNVYDSIHNSFTNVFSQSTDRMSNYFGSSLEARNGHIYFLFGGQLININPDDFFNQHIKERIFQLDEIRVNDQHYDSLKLSDLSYKQNSFYVRFGLLEFTNPEKVKYAYWLEGHDKKWNALGNQTEIRFNALAPNEYTLHIRANDLFGREVVKQIAIPFIISPPFWKAWWFLLFAGFILFLCSWLFIKWRERNIKAEEEVKTILEQQRVSLAIINTQLAEAKLAGLRSQMNPHFIFNALNSIKKFVVANEAIAAETYLGKFSKLIRAILDNSQSGMVSIAKEIQLLTLYLDIEQLRFRDRLQYQIVLQDDDMIQDVIIPSMLIQPFVENAIIHGIMHKESGGNIVISFRYTLQTIEVTIEDNGVGRAKSNEYKSEFSEPHLSVGIEVASKRINALHLPDANRQGVQIIDLYDDQSASTGTKVILTIPIN